MDVGEPVVEIGAYQTAGQEGFADLRPLFAGKEYLGCDLIPGPGVDRVEDVRSLSFADSSIGLVVCVDALEHVADPFRAVREIHRVLRPGGALVLVTPFAFPIHHRPDYTRFTPDGIRLLLGPFGACAVYSQGDAQSPHSVYSIARKGAVQEAAPALGRLAAEVERRWHEGGIHDALDRCEPLASLLRCDRPQRVLAALRDGLAVEQSFTCGEDGLCRVEVKLRAEGPLTVAALRLSVTDEAGIVLAAAQSRSVHAGADRWVAFSFAPLARCSGRRLNVRLQPLSESPRVDALASSVAVVLDGELRVGERREPGSLCFEAFRLR
jgi:SAM-dependent methyltransferase